MVLRTPERNGFLLRFGRLNGTERIYLALWAPQRKRISLVLWAPQQLHISLALWAPYGYDTKFRSRAWAAEGGGRAEAGWAATRAHTGGGRVGGQQRRARGRAAAAGAWAGSGGGAEAGGARRRRTAAAGSGRRARTHRRRARRGGLGSGGRRRRAAGSHRLAGQRCAQAERRGRTSGGAHVQDGHPTTQARCESPALPFLPKQESPKAETRIPSHPDMPVTPMYSSAEAAQAAGKTITFLVIGERQGMDPGYLGTSRLYGHHVRDIRYDIICPEVQTGVHSQVPRGVILTGIPSQTHS
ncbi:hypothetical protein GGX14DRAFT_397516 [Mycena pura]|uniref:Uncharacterized protein n=1 Tax=Mycena pura TaxID=153505 RepID=A0AAD6V8M4_9AGAR|nr:hypothetical protein GGX14DRAFT_397516 [Mycena pura]